MMTVEETEPLTLENAVKAFLSIGFNNEEATPFKTQREATYEEARQLGWYQAIDTMRQILRQVEDAEVRELAESPASPHAIQPQMMGNRRLWFGPHVPVKARER